MTDSQTIPDVHSIARDQLRAFVQRVERIEEEIKTLNDDKSDIYKEAAAVGFDKKTLKKVVARRKVDDSQRQEEDALFEIYWDAVHGTNLVHARVRENIEEFDAETGEILDGAANAKLIATVATGMQTETGRKALVTALDIMIEREEAEEQVPSSEQSEGNGSRDHQHVHSRQTDGAKHGGQDGEPAGADHATYSPETAEGETGMVLGTGRERPLSIGLHTDGDPEARFETASLHQDTQMDRATEGSFETGSEAAEKGREAIPAGPEGVDLSHAGAGESPATASKPKVSFRPNCLQPEMCRSGTRDHCYSCRKAMAQHEDAA